MSKTRPILFSAPMVRALLDGSKTQTRRAVKARADWAMGKRCILQPHELAGEVNQGDYSNCPYGKPGDRLWVREAWRTSKVADELKPSQLVFGGCNPIWHEAQNEVPFHPSDFGKLRPSIFMPRWASRITLEITGVRVERLHAINEVDAIAEGAPWAACGSPQDGSHKAGYAQLWESINGPGSWGLNPWVWVIEFKRVPA
jgi:hypothetical protein